MGLSRTYVRVLIICIIIAIFGTILVMKRRSEITIDTQPPKTQVHQVGRFDHDMLKENDKTERCEARHLSFIKDTNPKRTRIALASFPGSGNTWVRHLIQELTGYYTGSVYHDNNLAENGFLGERASTYDPNQQCIVYKTHEEQIAAFQKAIIIIRHPLNAIKAYFNFQYSNKYTSREGKVEDIQKNSTLVKMLKQDPHTGIVSSALFRSMYFEKFLNKKIITWEQKNIAWLKQFRGKCVVVLYENLKNNISFELKRIAKFLKIHVLPKHVICTVRNSEGNFHRDKKKSNLDIQKLLSLNQKNLINYAVQKVSKVVKRLNMSLDISHYFV